MVHVTFRYDLVVRLVLNSTELSLSTVDLTPIVVQTHATRILRSFFQTVLVKHVELVPDQTTLEEFVQVDPAVLPSHDAVALNSESTDNAENVLPDWFLMLTETDANNQPHAKIIKLEIIAIDAPSAQLEPNQM